MVEKIFSFQINLPNANALKESANPNPYWGKIWHSAIALSNFIEKNSEIFANKKVLELGAGLGLPSFVVSKYASKVICSDVDENAVKYMKQNIAANNITNITPMLLNWNTLPTTLKTDIVLLSDVNYSPENFAALLQTIQALLQKQYVIFLATPQRLLAKPFIQALAQSTVSNTEILIDYATEKKYINILQLSLVA